MLRKANTKKATLLAQRADGANSNWYYVKDGKKDTSVSGIVKCSMNGETDWYYVKNGLFKKATLLAQRADGSNKKWYYVKSGRVNSTATGLVHCTKNGTKTWYYVKKGVFTSYTGKAKRADGSNTKRYNVKNGVMVQ